MIKPLVSVIVPIFNTEKYLENCISSVLNQRLENIEIILVDDGSTDNSGKMCDEFSEKNNKIKVIHKVNEGVSVARNSGMKVARGKYIGFVDSDDNIHKDMYLKMYTKAEEHKCDIAMCDANIRYINKVENDTIKQLPQSMILEKNEITPKLLVEMAGSMCKCLYKKDLFVNNEILCPIGTKLSEDRIFNILSFGHSKKTFYLKESLYTQNIRENSATKKYYDNMLEIIMDGRKDMLSALNQSWNNDESYKKEYENQHIEGVWRCIINEFHNNCKKNIYEKYKGVKNIIDDYTVTEIINNIDIKSMKINLIRKKLSLIISIVAYLKYGE